MNDGTGKLAQSLQQEAMSRQTRYIPTSTSSDLAVGAKVAGAVADTFSDVGRVVSEMDRRAERHAEGSISSAIDLVENNPDFLAHYKTKEEALQASGEIVSNLYKSESKKSNVRQTIDQANRNITNFIIKHYDDAMNAKARLDVDKQFNTARDIVLSKQSDLWDPENAKKIEAESRKWITNSKKVYKNNPVILQYIDEQEQKFNSAVDSVKQKQVATHIGEVSMDYFTGMNKPYQSYRDSLRTKEGQKQLKALTTYMGEKRAKDFIKSQWESHIKSGASDLTVPLSELKEDIEYAGLKPELYDYVRAVRAEKIATPSHITTLDQKKLQVLNPDFATLSNQIDSESLIDGKYNFDLGVAKSIENIRNDDSLTNSEKLYRENAVKQLGNLKKAKLNENAMEVAISQGVVTPDGLTKVSPENKFASKMEAGITVGKLYNVEPSFFTTSNIEQLKANDPEYIDNLKPLINLPNPPSPEAQVALNKQLRKTGTKLDYYADAGITATELKLIGAQPEKSGVILPRQEFFERVTNPSGSFVSSIGRPDESLSGSYIQSMIYGLNGDNKKVINLLSKDKDLADRVYSVYVAKNKLLNKGKIDVPTAEEAFKEAGLEVSDVGTSEFGILSKNMYTIYHKKGVDPTPAVDQLSNDLEALRSQYKTNISRNQEDFEIKNIDVDTIGVFSKKNGKIVVDESTGVPLMVNLRNPSARRPQTTSGLISGNRGE